MKHNLLLLQLNCGKELIWKSHMLICLLKLVILQLCLQTDLNYKLIEWISRASF